MEILRNSRGLNNYFEIRADGNESLSSYEEGMLRNNQIRSLAPLFIQWVDGQQIFLYKTDGMVGIARRWGVDGPGWPEVYSLLRSIADCIRELQEYLLPPEGLVLSLPYLMYDGSTGTVRFLYAPKYGTAFAETMKRLLEEIMQIFHHENETEMMHFYDTYGRFLDGSITPEIFLQMIEAPLAAAAAETEGAGYTGRMAGAVGSATRGGDSLSQEETWNSSGPSGRRDSPSRARIVQRAGRSAGRESGMSVGGSAGRGDSADLGRGTGRGDSADAGRGVRRGDSADAGRGLGRGDSADAGRGVGRGGSAVGRILGRGKPPGSGRAGDIEGSGRHGGYAGTGDRGNSGYAGSTGSGDSDGHGMEWIRAHFREIMIYLTGVAILLTGAILYVVFGSGSLRFTAMIGAAFVVFLFCRLVLGDGKGKTKEGQADVFEGHVETQDTVRAEEAEAGGAYEAWGTGPNRRAWDDMTRAGMTGAGAAEDDMTRTGAMMGGMTRAGVAGDGMTRVGGMRDGMTRTGAVGDGMTWAGATEDGMMGNFGSSGNAAEGMPAVWEPSRTSVLRGNIRQLVPAEKGVRAPLYVSEGYCRIGRSEAENEYCIPKPAVSRNHALLECCGDVVTLQDLGSTNGTYINHVRLKSTALEELHYGDVVSFAGEEFYVI